MVYDKEEIWTMARLVRMYLFWKMDIKSISSKTGMTPKNIRKLIKKALDEHIIIVRYDRMILEWQCPHGCGHPLLAYTDNPSKMWDVHGCHNNENGESCCAWLYND